MEDVEVVVAHRARVTVRVGGMFLKIDADQANLDAEVAAMALSPIPTPDVLWQKPSVLAISAVSGTALGRLGQPSPASAAVWSAAGAALRRLHEAPPPAGEARSLVRAPERLDEECELLVRGGILPADIVARNRDLAQNALRTGSPVFIHGDLQATHVFFDGDEITGVIDWSEAGSGPALFDVATLTLGHPEHVGDVIAGYGAHVDVELIRAFWALRSLLAVRWLVEHGFDPSVPGAEIDVLKGALPPRL